MRKLIYVGDPADFHFRDKALQITKILDDKVLSIFSGLSIESFDLALLAGRPIDRLSRFELKVSGGFFNVQVLRNGIKGLCYIVNIIWFVCYRLCSKGAVFHSFTMYYIFLTALVHKGFIATPQASEVLHRMRSSFWYRFFSVFALRRAHVILVDSVDMQNALLQFGLSSIVHKNGFDTTLAGKYRNIFNLVKKKGIVSLRGLSPLYQILNLINERNGLDEFRKLHFVYPSSNERYQKKIEMNLNQNDELIGKLEKHELYSFFSKILLGVSIPKTDSSPRTVYEAIFCGCIVAVRYEGYIAELPECMQARLIIVDTNKAGWLLQALEAAEKLIKKEYVPSAKALEGCDAELLANRLVKDVYLKL